MENQFKVEQYNNQSNLVYISSMILSTVMIFILYFVVGSTLAAVINLIGVGLAGIAVYLNHRKYYGVAALIFIGYISIIAVIQGILFGLNSGFQYFFFNMAGLIMYSSWKNGQKLLGLIAEFILFNVLFFTAYHQEPIVILEDHMMYFFHTVNVILNLIGVSNSAYYFIGIATKSHNRVLHLAMRDYLTNLMNRTSFDTYITETFKNRVKNRQNVAIMLLDIDHFKNVNDTWGHLCGDEILRQYASILMTHVRSGDLVARYGGEEFVIVAMMENPQQLKQLSERLRKEVEDQVFIFGSEKIRITTSIGAVYIPASVTIDQYKAIDLADKRLYQAKAEGRNRVIYEIL